MPSLLAKRFFRVLLILLTLGGILTQPGLALCIGSDGHLAVEVSSASLVDCFVGAKEDIAIHGTSLMSASCGPCRDLELPLWTVAPAPREDVSSPSMIQLSLVETDFGVRDLHAESAAHPALSISVESSRARHTVVIRC